jgi:phosphoglycolate phosphatase
MSQFNIILFDLDNTLTDPFPEMIAAGQYALKQFDIHEEDPKKLELFTKVPLLECFEQHFGLTMEQANRAFNHYWHFQTTFGASKNRVYPGVVEMLQELHGMDKTLCVATARTDKNAVAVVKGTKLDSFFEVVVGTNEEISRQSKRMVIFDLLCHYPDHHHEEVVMVGDRVADIIGAKDNGIYSIGVTWGMDTEDELLDAGANVVAHSVEEMADLLTGRQEFKPIVKPQPQAEPEAPAE